MLFPIRGICGGGLRSLVRAAKERNICLNIGIGTLGSTKKIRFIFYLKGNQRPVKTETNRRTGIDEFVLVSNTTQVIKSKKICVKFSPCFLLSKNNLFFRITLASLEIFLKRRYLNTRDSFGMIRIGFMAQFGRNLGLSWSRI